MKPCNYCGLQNEESATNCGDCGSPLEQPAAPRLIVEAGPRLNAAFATLVLLAYFGAQVIASVLVMAAAMVLTGANLNESNQIKHVTEKAMGPAMLGAMLGGGIAMFGVSYFRLGSHLFDRASTGAAWVAGQPKQVLSGLGAGTLLGLLSVLLATVFRGAHHGKSGPVTELAMNGGAGRVIWILMAVLLAPVIEELLFRGVLYGGYCASWGTRKAALATTTIFCLLHVTETIYFWPSMLGIAGLAAVALWLRLQHNAIGPAVAAHCGYNAVVSALLLIPLR